MKLNEYQELSKRTMPKMVEGKHDFYYDDRAKSNYGLGITGEAGEVADYLKKVIFHQHDLDEVKLKQELGDVLHYVAGLCTMYGFRLEEVATLNVVKLQERYPDGFRAEDSIKRKDVKQDYWRDN